MLTRRKQRRSAATRGRKRLRSGLVLGTIATATVASLVAPASAADPGQHPSWAVGGTVQGAPAELGADFADCPTDELFPEGRAPFACIVLTAYNGELKLGNTVASIDDPIEMTIGVTAFGDIVMGQGGGAPEPVKISGGILGIPALDPVLDLTLGILSVSATPTIGAAGPGRSDDPPPAEGEQSPAAAEFGAWAVPFAGTPTSRPVELNLPLSIQLNNLLFGPNCTIPEFDINLTTGTTNPPPGVPPMTGIEEGDVVYTEFAKADGTTGGVRSRVGTRFVDNTFAVESASRCDLVFGGLLGMEQGLFDSAIGQQTGLPSAAGNNYAAFDIDVRTALYAGVLSDLDLSPTYCGFWCQEFGLDPGPGMDFGDVPIGTTKTLAGTITNAGFLPRTLEPATAPAAPFAIVSDGCAGVLQPGASCDIVVSASPTALGKAESSTSVGYHAGGVNFEFGVNGTPAPVAAVASTPTTTAPKATVSAPVKRCLNLLGIQVCL